jgi:hypothetical protein
MVRRVLRRCRLMAQDVPPRAQPAPAVRRHPVVGAVGPRPASRRMIGRVASPGPRGRRPQGTGAFSGIPGHSEAFSVSASPEARRRCAPNGNQMATICAPTRVIPGCSRNAWGGGPEWARSSCRVLIRRPSSGLKERARLNGRSLQQEVKALQERMAETLTMREARRLSDRWDHRLAGRFDVRQRVIDPRGSRFTMSGATPSSMT